MKNLCRLLIFVVLITSSIFGKQSQHGHNLNIEVEGIRNSNGLIGISIYNSPHGFPNDLAKAIKTEFVTIKDNKAKIAINNLSEGYYAISVFHDENGNRKIESNWIGLPKEGVGVSNNVKASFGPPKFNDAKFMLNRSEQIITISLFYL